MRLRYPVPGYGTGTRVLRITDGAKEISAPRWQFNGGMTSRFHVRVLYTTMLLPGTGICTA